MRVVREWIDDLPLRIQSTLLLSMRGPDGVSKEGPAKVLIRELRYTILMPAFPKELFPDKKDDTFMGTQTGYVWGNVAGWNAIKNFKENHDEYPHHWLMHFLHAAEIVGQYHPQVVVRQFWWSFYVEMCAAFHMNIETLPELDMRLQDPQWIAEEQVTHGRR